jgi:hypothetical protein
MHSIQKSRSGAIVRTPGQASKASIFGNGELEIPKNGDSATLLLGILGIPAIPEMPFRCLFPSLPVHQSFFVAVGHSSGAFLVRRRDHRKE